MNGIQPNQPSSNSTFSPAPASPSNGSANEFNNAMSSTSACSLSNHAHNIATGTAAGVGAGAIPCVLTTGAYPACVALAGIGGAASGAFVTGVQCTSELLGS